MIDRNLTPFLRELALQNHKMVFLSGPRQVGKTTLARSLLTNEQNYFNWDHLPVRRRWQEDSDRVAKDVLSSRVPRMVLDEFHKNRKWRNQLKGFFDQYGKNIEIILTGSARLNAFRRGSDSLVGRFFHFHLLPFTLGELAADRPQSFLDFQTCLHSPRLFRAPKNSAQLFERLLQRGGFPESYENPKAEFRKLWSKNRNELLIRQDLKENSALLNLPQLELLASYLPERVGSPLSIQNLREDLDVAHTTASRWLSALVEIYYHFEIRPYSRSVIRSLKKSQKIYLYDWTSIEDKGPRFENTVALHLLKLVHFYNDTGQASLELKYLRDKDGYEVDFLLTQKGKPICSIEAKLSDLNLDLSYRRFHRQWTVPHFQIISEESFLRSYDSNSHVISFDRFFGRTP